MKPEHAFIEITKAPKGVPTKWPFAAVRQRAVSEIADGVAQTAAEILALPTPNRKRLSELAEYLKGMMVAQHRNMLGEVYRLVDTRPEPMTKDQLLDWLHQRAQQISNDLDVKDPHEITLAETEHFKLKLEIDRETGEMTAGDIEDPPKLPKS